MDMDDETLYKAIRTLIRMQIGNKYSFLNENEETLIGTTIYFIKNGSNDVEQSYKDYRNYNVYKYFCDSVTDRGIGQTDCYNSEELVDKVFEHISDEFDEEKKIMMVKAFIDRYLRESESYRMTYIFQEFAEEFISLLRITHGEDISPRDYCFGMAGCLEQIGVQANRDASGHWSFPDREEFKVLEYYNSEFDKVNDNSGLYEPYTPSNLDVIRATLEKTSIGRAKEAISVYFTKKADLDSVSLIECMSDIRQKSIFDGFNKTESINDSDEDDREFDLSRQINTESIQLIFDERD